MKYQLKNIKDWVLGSKKGDSTDWKRKRCPKCESLLFEVDQNNHPKESVRVKCRKCKEIITV